jgi:hypothetical protein
MSTLTTLPLYSVARLTSELHGWPAGTVGTIVEDYGEAGAEFEIADSEGMTLGLFGVAWSALERA